MRLLFDFLHPAHINFYKHLVRRLRDEGHEIVLVCLDRGKVPRIVRQEFPDFEVHLIGKYARSKIGLYFRTGLLRALHLAWFILRTRPDATLSVAGFQTDFMSCVLRHPSLGAYDDPDHVNFSLSRRFLDRFILPECLGYSGPNIVPMRGLKEWAYLSPKYFEPNEAAVVAIGLKPKDYIFIRDVDTVSLNYRSQVENNIKRLYDSGLSEENVVLSLENKSLRSDYPKWRILEEPVEDIHSLMHYARMLISSGDSMAREGAEMGVEAIYCGTRDMAANRALIDIGFLHHVTDTDEILRRLRGGEFDLTPQEQAARRQRLLDEWDDPNTLLYDSLMDLTGQKG
jgi:uncharacterized protein